MKNDNYYDELIEKGYKRLGDAPYDSWGCFACTIGPNLNIELFILEIYFLKKEKSRKYLREDTPELFLLEYRIDDKRNRIKSKRKKYSNYNPKEVQGIIKSGQYNSQINGLTMNYLTDSDLQTAINMADALAQENKRKGLI